MFVYGGLQPRSQSSSIVAVDFCFSEKDLAIEKDVRLGMFVSGKGMIRHYPVGSSTYEHHSERGSNEVVVPTLRIPLALLLTCFICTAIVVCSIVAELASVA